MHDFICRYEILRYIVVMKRCCCDFFSKYFVLKLDRKTFVSTSFHVCDDVLNIQNKVLNLTEVWKKCFWCLHFFFVSYYIFFKIVKKTL